MKEQSKAMELTAPIKKHIDIAIRNFTRDVQDNQRMEEYVKTLEEIIQTASAKITKMLNEIEMERHINQLSDEQKSLLKQLLK